MAGFRSLTHLSTLPSLAVFDASPLPLCVCGGTKVCESIKNALNLPNFELLSTA